jgi:hypothetical protein
MFSSILDISSFFIGMLINLLLIALICYYFKRKYESLEVSQNEQAKILYSLIQNQTPSSKCNINELIANPKLKNTMMSNPEELIDDESSEDEDEDEEGSSLNEDDEELVEENTIKILTVNNNIEEIEDLEEISNITVTKIEEPVEEPPTSEVTDYSKLSIKELKDILSKKGINSNHRMKKNDLINLIENGKTDTLNLKSEIGEVIL